MAAPKLKDKMSRFFEDKTISQENILALSLHLKALKNSTDARRDAFRDKVMTMLRQFVVSYSIRLIPKYLQNLKIFSFLQDIPSDDEPAPLVGEKRVHDDDDDPLFATGTQTGTQTGTGNENENENENEDGTRTEPEDEEEESGPASPVFNQAGRSRQNSIKERILVIHLLIQSPGVSDGFVYFWSRHCCYCKLSKEDKACSALHYLSLIHI